MNFFGHAVVACWEDAHASHVLGSMLPDFEAMMGVQLVEVHDQQVVRGIDFHHRTDEAFHRTQSFRSLSSDALEALSEAGVRRGTARAVAHIATELFLDGDLAQEEHHAPDYLAALDVDAEPRLHWKDGGKAYETLVARLTVWGAPRDYADPVFVLHRLRDALRRRPALAIADDEVQRVTACLPTLQRSVHRKRRELLDELHEALGFGN